MCVLLLAPAALGQKLLMRVRCVHVLSPGGMEGPRAAHAALAPGRPTPKPLRRGALAPASSPPFPALVCASAPEPEAVGRGDFMATCAKRCAVGCRPACANIESARRPPSPQLSSALQPPMPTRVDGARSARTSIAPRTSWLPISACLTPALAAVSLYRDKVAANATYARAVPGVWSRSQGNRRPRSVSRW